MLLFTAFLLLGAVSCRQHDDAWDRFIATYGAHGATIRVNGLIKWGLDAFGQFNDDPESRAILGIVRKMKGVEIHIIPARRVPEALPEVEKLGGRLEREGYGSLVNVRASGSEVNLWAKGDDDVLSDPLALVRDGETLVMVKMRGTLTAADLQTLLHAAGHYAAAGPDSSR